MTQATLKKTWLNKLAYLYEKIDEQDEHIPELIDLIRKTEQNELTIAFCGHFSAGKSSIMNYLFGTQILPTSPIPTSANVVTVKRGPERIRLQYADGYEQQVVGTYSDKAFQALCKDGERSIGVILEREDLPIPEGVAIVDTPGIDSTDEAHKLATETHLHIADVIFYMMDYNHVQAEGNLQFIKDLAERGKQIYPIINQIDKHRQSELPFSVFEQSVKEAFVAWGIKKNKIFYTTLKQPNHPQNQINEVKALLQKIYLQKDELMEHNLILETRFLLTQHIKQKAAAYTPLGNCLEQKNEWTEKKAEIVQKLVDCEQEKQEITTGLTRELDQLLQNAYLMPANLRDLARSYLEAMQPDFKVGLLFARNKTEQEIQKREHIFLETLTKTVSTQLSGHIEELVLRHARKYGIYNKLGKDLHQTIPILSTKLLQSTIKPGAGLTGNYVLTYTTDLADQLKASYRGFVRSYLTKYLPLLESKVQKEIKQLENELKTITNELNSLENIINIHHNLEQEQLALYAVLDQNNVPAPAISIEQLLCEKVILKPNTTKLIDESTADKEPKQLQSQVGEERATNSFQEKLQILRSVEERIKQVPSLQTVFQSLQTRRLQMEQQQFTVALFGAFSAGKSSFANALLGAPLLPVSPNPTTATVCRICPPTKEYAHGRGTVTFKSTDTLTTELIAIFQLFQKKVTTLSEAINQIPELISKEMVTTRQKLALPFMRAIQQGYAHVNQILGSTQEMSQQDVISFIANEEKSAFVEEVSLYYDSDLAKLGITLVDTPGADSLHARHTDVAFRYMKQADAILFVTYYNHAFSRADRELLIQLGRVQGSFALDKMYFIVNAADLASSSVELSTVVSYVEEQLTHYGIRQPRMYAVSSLQSLAEKQQNQAPNTAFSKFEQSFLRFIQEDSRQTLLGRMTKDVQDAIKWLDDLLISINSSVEEKANQRIKWKQNKNLLLEQIKALNSNSEQRALTQELKTLLYYVGERLRLRYYDEFAVFINPSTVREAGRLGRKQLRLAAMEFLSFLGNDFVQELRATTLRMEKWILNTTEQFKQHWETDQKELLAGLQLQDVLLPEIEDPKWITPEWDNEHLDFLKAISTYKNNHSFFEESGRDLMREQLKSYFDSNLNLQVEQAMSIINDYCLTIWNRWISIVHSAWSDQVTVHFIRLESSLQENTNKEQLVEVKNELQQSLNQLFQ